jgi:flagellar assembly protein FliH
VSTVIKAGEAGRILRRLSTVDLADHLAEARAVIEEARRRAAQIVSRAEDDAKRLLEEVRQEGHGVGHEAGYAAGSAAGRKEAFEAAKESFAREHSNVVASMLAAITQFDQMKEELRTAATRDLLDFAVLVASRLTFAIGGVHRETAAENLRRAISVVGLKTDLTVRVNPEDVVAMRTFAASVLEEAKATTAVWIVEDPSLAPGGCVVRNDRSEVDASLETQVAEMVSLLIGKASDD